MWNKVRQRGQCVLKDRFNRSAAKQIENYIFCYTEGEQEYLDMIYECVSNDWDAIDALHCIMNNRTGWNDSVYDSYAQYITEQDAFIERPVQVEEGIGECTCGSKKTLSYSKQTRSCDEGTTVFFTCVECGRKWREG